MNFSPAVPFTSTTSSCLQARLNWVYTAKSDMADLEESWRALLAWLDAKHGWNSAELKVEWKDVPGESDCLYIDRAPSGPLLT